MQTEQFDKNTWQTPPYFSKWVAKKWHCTIDGASFSHNKVCGHWIGKMAEGEDSAAHITDDFLADNLPDYLSNWGGVVIRFSLIHLTPTLRHSFNKLNGYEMRGIWW